MTVSAALAATRAATTGPAPRRAVAWALGGWVLLLVTAWIWGLALPADELHLGAIPLYGRWELAPAWRLALPVAVGAAAVLVLPGLAARWPWRRVLGA
ncbi:hypothetical protein DY240_03165, partial [Jiangella rhizosphaerae]